MFCVTSITKLSMILKNHAFFFFKNQNKYRDEIESIMGAGLEGLT